MSKQIYWVSKYALTDGVMTANGDPYVFDERFINLDGRWSSFRLGRDVHTTEAEAKKAAESMRLKKIASLKKQIAKLEELKF